MTAMMLMEPTVEVFGPRSTTRRNKSVRARLSKVGIQMAPAIAVGLWDQ